MFQCLFVFASFGLGRLCLISVYLNFRLCLGLVFCCVNAVLFVFFSCLVIFLLHYILRCCCVTCVLLCALAFANLFVLVTVCYCFCDFAGLYV